MDVKLSGSVSRLHRGGSGCRELREVGVINDLPRMVRRMLMKKSAPQPRSRKTPTGGRMMARRILQMSLKPMLVHVSMSSILCPYSQQLEKSILRYLATALTADRSG
jgi:hypothetical protein